MTPKLQITALLKNDMMKFIRYSRLFSRNIKQTGRRHILRVFGNNSDIHIKQTGYNTSQIPLYLACLDRISNTTFWLRPWPLVRNSAHSWARQCTESWGCQFLSIRKQRRLLESTQIVHGVLPLSRCQGISYTGMSHTIRQNKRASMETEKETP